MRLCRKATTFCNETKKEDGIKCMMSEDEYFRILKDHDMKVISKDIALLFVAIVEFKRTVSSTSLSLSLSNVCMYATYTHTYISISLCHIT